MRANTTHKEFRAFKMANRAFSSDDTYTCPVCLLIPLHLNFPIKHSYLMKTMKNKIPIVTMMTLMVLALAGCGQKTPEENPPPAAPNTPASPSAPAMTNSTSGQTPPAGTNQ
jgi:predicted small lipoprotein YifL